MNHCVVSYLLTPTSYSPMELVGTAPTNKLCAQAHVVASKREAPALLSRKARSPAAVNSPTCSPPCNGMLLTSLSLLTTQCFHTLRGQKTLKSLTTFSHVSKTCLQEQPKQRQSTRRQKKCQAQCVCSDWSLPRSNLRGLILEGLHFCTTPNTAKCLPMAVALGHYGNSAFGVRQHTAH